ncbi:MAG: Do family serine endopeptidase [Calditrichaeota bacterium]|nr:Do family serine endopeptidase [Calditrichota bacterium]
MKSQKFSIILIFAIFVGIVTGLIIASNFNLPLKGVAADSEKETVKPVVLGSNEPVSEELLGLEKFSKAFAKVAEKVSPSVVTISSQSVVKRRTNPFFQDDFFRQFFNVPEEQEQILRGLGSGVIINPDGYILTNNHVVKDADELTVTIAKKDYDAKVVGTDPESDLAVIKIDKTGLPAIKLGNSDDLEVGEWVLAIGNPFDKIFRSTVTAGIVSAKGRTLPELGGGKIQYQDFIQTDAAINPGNSGGALVNLRGELIGINTAILGRANVGIGFAIPVNLAHSVMQQLISEGHVIRGYLGVMISNVSDEMAQFYKLDEAKGAFVNQVVEDSPAGKAGVKEEDIIIKLNDEKIENRDQLTNKVASYPPDSKVKLTVWRDGKEKVLTVKLAERPSGGIAKSEESTKNENKLGIEVQDLTNELARRLGYEDGEGVIITSVKGNSIAAREGLREGQLITAVNRQPVHNVREFNKIIRRLKPNDIVLFKLKYKDMSFFRAIRIPKDKK